MGLAKQQGANPTLRVCLLGGGANLQHNKVPYSRVGPPTQPGQIALDPC